MKFVFGKRGSTFIGAAISPDVDKVSVEAVENDALPETLTIRSFVYPSFVTDIGGFNVESVLENDNWPTV